MKKLQDVVSWAACFFWLVACEKQAAYSRYFRPPSSELLLAIRRAIRAYNNMPMPLAIAVRASLVVFALLPIMPLHPLSIPVTMGSGLSVAVILSAFRI